MTARKEETRAGHRSQQPTGETCGRVTADTVVSNGLFGRVGRAGTATGGGARHAAVLVAVRGGRFPGCVERAACVRPDAPAPVPDRRDRPPPPALRPGARAGLDLPVLGVALARGVRLRASDRGAAALCVRVRHAARVLAPRQPHARFRPVPGRLQHQPVPVVQGRLVLFPIRADCGRVRRQGADPLEQGGTAGPHLQPLVVAARRLLPGAAADRNLEHHLGLRNRQHAELRASHLPAHLPGQPAGTIAVRRHDDDDVGGRHDVPVRTLLLRIDRHLLLLRFVHPDRRVPRHAPAVQRPIHVAAQAGLDGSCSACCMRWG